MIYKVPTKFLFADLVLIITTTKTLVIPLEKKRNDLLMWISSCPHKQHHDDILGGGEIMENTGGWLFETDDFYDWIKKSESPVFWLNGDRKFHEIPPVMKGY